MEDKIISDLKTFSKCELHILYKYYNIDNSFSETKKLHSLAEKIFKKGEINNESDELFKAINKKDIDSIKKIIESNKININKPLKNSYTFLMVATQYLEAAQLLLEYGADPNIQNNEGNTALMLAAEYLEDPKITKVLLKYGADPNIQNNEGDTALILAIKSIEYAPKQKVDSTKKMENTKKTIKTLIKNPRINLNLQNKNQESALTIAAELNNTYAISKLLDAGVDIPEGLTSVIEIKAEELKSAIKKLKKLLDKDEEDLYNNTAGKECKKSKLTLAGLNSLKKCKDMLIEMVKYKPGGEEMSKLEKKYEKHSYFKK